MWESDSRGPQNFWADTSALLQNSYPMPATGTPSSVPVIIFKAGARPGGEVACWPTCLSVSWRIFHGACILQCSEWGREKSLLQKLPGENRCYMKKPTAHCPQPSERDPPNRPTSVQEQWPLICPQWQLPVRGHLHGTASPPSISTSQAFRGSWAQMGIWGS